MPILRFVGQFVFFLAVLGLVLLSGLSGLLARFCRRLEDWADDMLWRWEQ